MSRSWLSLSYVLINYGGYYNVGIFLFFNMKCPWFQCYIFVWTEAWPNKVGYFLGFCIRLKKKKSEEKEQNLNIRTER